MSEIDRILAARRPADLFGELTGTVAEQLKKLKKAFRVLAKATHTDRSKHPEAGEAFRVVNEMYAIAEEAVRSGRYHAASRNVRLETRKGRYVAEGSSAFGGASCDFHFASFTPTGGEEREALLKMPRSPAENDALRAEASALAKLFRSGEAIEDAAFFPALIEQIRIRTGSKRRTALAFERPVGRWFNLAQVHAQYPGGVNAKDVAWMFQRALYALGVAARQGLVHGAILPEHILIEPDEHGLMIVDWKFAVEAGSVIRRIPSGSRGWYPQEVLKKEPATTRVDIYMMARVFDWLVDPGARLRMFFKGCTQSSPALRPDEPWALRDEFIDLIERLWGQRRFRKFTMKGSQHTGGA